MYESSVVSQYFEDLRERKQIARGGRYKKCGSKSKRCCLPSDHLTTKEWTKMNGPVVSVNLNQPISWDDFRSLPNHLKEEYLTALHNQFGVTKAVLSEVFGVSVSSLTRAIEGCDVEKIFHPGKKMVRSNKEALYAFFGLSDRAEEPKQEPAFTGAPQSSSSMSMQGFTLTFDGAFDAEHISNSLRHLIQTGTSVKIQIACTMKENNHG